MVVVVTDAILEASRRPGRLNAPDADNPDTTKSFSWGNSSVGRLTISFFPLELEPWTMT